MPHNLTPLMQTDWVWLYQHSRYLDEDLKAVAKHVQTPDQFQQLLNIRFIQSLKLINYFWPNLIHVMYQERVVNRKINNSQQVVYQIFSQAGSQLMRGLQTHWPKPIMIDELISIGDQPNVRSYITDAIHLFVWTEPKIIDWLHQHHYYILQLLRKEGPDLNLITSYLQSDLIQMKSPMQSHLQAKQIQHQIEVLKLLRHYRNYLIKKCRHDFKTQLITEIDPSLAHWFATNFNHSL